MILKRISSWYLIYNFVYWRVSHYWNVIGLNIRHVVKFPLKPFHCSIKNKYGSNLLYPLQTQFRVSFQSVTHLKSLIAVYTFFSQVLPFILNDIISRILMALFIQMNVCHRSKCHIFYQQRHLWVCTSVQFSNSEYYLMKYVGSDVKYYITQRGNCHTYL